MYSTYFYVRLGARLKQERKEEMLPGHDSVFPTGRRFG